LPDLFSWASNPVIVSWEMEDFLAGDWIAALLAGVTLWEGVEALVLSFACFSFLRA
jgi:hypothetical protein